jgi:hypothetical protein
MKTTTENITLSPDLAPLSPENLSTLIDTWLELQTSAVEVIQSPTPDIFSFAENSCFFAVILKNEQLPSSAGESKLNESLNDIIQLKLVRTMEGSLQVPYAWSLAGSSSSTLVPADGTSGRLSDASMSVSPEGEWRPDLFEQTAPELESYKRRNAFPNRRTYQTDVEKLPSFNLSDVSLMTDIAYAHNPANRSVSLSEIF